MLAGLLGQQNLHRSVLHHEGQPLLRIGGIERHVGSAGFPDTQQCGDHLRRALQADADQALGSDSRLWR